MGLCQNPNKEEAIERFLKNLNFLNPFSHKSNRTNMKLKHKTNRNKQLQKHKDEWPKEKETRLCGKRRKSQLQKCKNQEQKNLIIIKQNK